MALLILLPLLFLLLHGYILYTTSSRMQEKRSKELLEQLVKHIENQGRIALSLADLAGRMAPETFESLLHTFPGGEHCSGLVIRDKNGNVVLRRAFHPSGEEQLIADLANPNPLSKQPAGLEFGTGIEGIPYLVAHPTNRPELGLYFSPAVFGLEKGLAGLEKQGMQAILTLENKKILTSTFSQRFEGLPTSILLPSFDPADKFNSQFGQTVSGQQELVISTNGKQLTGIRMKTVWDTIRSFAEPVRLYLLVPDSGPTSGTDILLYLAVILLGLGACAAYIFLYKNLSRLTAEVRYLPQLQQDIVRLKEASLRYSVLFNSMIDGIILLDLQGRILDCNRTFAEMLGYEPKELIGTNLRLLTPPRFWQTENENTSTRISNWGFTKDYEKEFIRKDGSTVPVMMSSCRTQDPDKNGSFVLSTLHDISEQKRALDKINRLNSLLEDIIESSTLSLLTLDEQMRIRMLNSAAERFFRIERNQVINQSLFEVVPFFERLRSLFERAISENKPMFQGNESIVFAENDEKHVNITIYPLHSSASGSVAVHLEDITDHVHLEHRLFQSQKMEALGRLASEFAHEFNNLLSGIFSYLTVIKMKTTDNELLEPLGLVYNIAQRASTLVKHILIFSRSRKITKACVNICAAVDEMMTIICESFPKNIVLEYSVSDRDCWILGDQSLIAQVLLNLCINARDAMPEGGKLTISLERLRISVEEARRFRSLEPGNVVRITVTDTGMGIEPAIVDRIFEPFFTTKSDHNGTGMGLSIVHGILDSHHGDVELSSTPGRGTSISILLPLVDGPKTPSSKREATIQPLLFPREHSGRLVVIDDEEIIGGALREGFTRMGFDVRTALNGEEGLRLCRESLPDLVILDMIMPGLGGENTFDLLKKEFPALKIVIHTGFTQEDVEQRMLDKGALDVLHKPYDMVAVAEKLANWIKGSLS